MAEDKMKVLRSLLDHGETLMNGGKRVLDLGALAKSRVDEGRCAVCGEEETMASSPLGANCAKRGASLLIDLVGRGGVK